jgi:hypothetical protein
MPIRQETIVRSLLDSQWVATMPPDLLTVYFGKPEHVFVRLRKGRGFIFRRAKKKTGNQNSYANP